MRYNNCIEHFAVCNICGKKFKFIVEEQEPGFRMLDELHCPYCDTKLDQSMEVEFSCVEGLEPVSDDSKGKRRKKKCGN